jgi:hypothetical protein
MAGRRAHYLFHKANFHAHPQHLTDQTAFGPAAIEAMSKAFEEACNALQVFAGDARSLRPESSI